MRMAAAKTLKLTMYSLPPAVFPHVMVAAVTAPPVNAVVTSAMIPVRRTLAGSVAMVASAVSAAAEKFANVNVDL